MLPESMHLVHFKNGIYNGYLTNSKREGTGIAIMDS